MAEIITFKGENRIAEAQGNNDRLVIDRFILSYYPDADPNLPIDRNSPLPAKDKIVYESLVTQAGYVNPNQVVYSLFMGSAIGPFKFNRMDLIESETKTNIAIATFPTQNKIADNPEEEIRGQSMTRNFMLIYDGAQKITNITVEAEIWQFDFMARLKASDEIERLTNRDTWGRSCFLKDSFKIVNDGGKYQILPGSGYLEGIKITSPDNWMINPGTLPKNVFIDIFRSGSINSLITEMQIVISEDAMTDYIDNQYINHYVELIANIDKYGNIIDKRNIHNIDDSLLEYLVPEAPKDGKEYSRKNGMWILDSFRRSVESATGGRNTVLYDIHGNANVMVVIPKFSYDELQMTANMGTGICTAFLKGGVEMPEVFIGKYLASGAQAVSMSGVDPQASINFDSAKSVCQAKGGGWHLMSMHEWAALSLWCMANGFQPKGNTEYGRAHDKKWEFGKRYDGRLPNDRSGTGRTNCGSGPSTWAHDQTDAGVYDLVGDVWEWQDHLKIQDGQIICAPDNDDTLLEAQWVAQACFFDSSTEGDGSGSSNLGSPFLNNQVTKYAGLVGDNNYYDYNYRGDWKNMSKGADYVSNELMKRLMIEPVKDILGGIWVRNYGERLPLRGGYWSGGSGAGLAALNLTDARSFVHSSIGFRPAFALGL